MFKICHILIHMFKNHKQFALGIFIFFVFAKYKGAFSLSPQDFLRFRKMKARIMGKIIGIPAICLEVRTDHRISIQGPPNLLFQLISLRGR